MSREQVVMASDFKQRCLALLDRVAEDGISIVVTKHGRPVARVQPIEQEPEVRPTMGSVRLVAERDEDYFSTGEAWDVEGSQGS